MQSRTTTFTTLQPVLSMMLQRIQMYEHARDHVKCCRCKRDNNKRGRRLSSHMYRYIRGFHLRKLFLMFPREICESENLPWPRLCCRLQADAPARSMLVSEPNDPFTATCQS